MKCAEITDHVIKAVRAGKYDFIKLKLPQRGHGRSHGNYQAVICAMEAMDLQLARLKAAVEAAGGILLLTADHGMPMTFRTRQGWIGEAQEDGSPKAKTAHSLNPVPFIIIDRDYAGEYDKELAQGLGISSIAATCMNLLGFEPPADYDKSIIDLT